MTIPPELAQFIRIVIALVIVLDPLGNVPVLVGVSSRLNRAATRRLVFHMVAGGTVLLLFFTVTGTWVLKLFGVSINDLRIAGGLLLLLISLKMVVEGRLGASREDEYEAAIVPLISPLLVGPGAITAAVVFAAIYGVPLTSLAVLAAMVICLLLFLCTKMVQRLLGESGTSLVTRVMGVLVATIAVNYIRDGIFGVLQAFKSQ